jgi:hypothetical protein
MHQRMKNAGAEIRSLLQRGHRLGRLKRVRLEKAKLHASHRAGVMLSLQLWTVLLAT